MSRISPAGSDAAAPPRVAVVGGGITGLAAAHALSRAGLAPVLFEAQARLGGHAHDRGQTAPTPPAAACATASTSASWSSTAHLPGLHRAAARARRAERALGHVVLGAGARRPERPRAAPGMERHGWTRSSRSAPTWLSPPFWRMLADIRRFNRLATALAGRMHGTGPGASLAEFLAAHRFRTQIPEVICRRWWPAASGHCPPAQMLRTGALAGVDQVLPQPRPAADQRPAALVHGARRLAALRCGARGDAARRAQHCAPCAAQPAAGRRSGRRVGGGPRRRRIRRRGAGLPCAAARRCWADASALPCSAPCAPVNRAVLHTDAALLPRLANLGGLELQGTPAGVPDSAGAVCLHYWINRLQPLLSGRLIVSLNPVRSRTRQRAVGG